ncbi:hypothetical protein [Lysobacter sp. ESA13C]|uniref:hypothetical protein n=1 Tax=Lysobacter sp. ESA13C TaxID=2862676 RepID=UPI001CBAEA09|nr:hypothetical protein [Lysobacter sp. ESA13C]
MSAAPPDASFASAAAVNGAALNGASNGASMSRTAADPIRTELDHHVGLLALHVLGRELSDGERVQVSAALDAIDADSKARAAAPAGAPTVGQLGRSQAGNLIESGRQRIEDVIEQSLRRTQATVRKDARAEREAEAAVLGAVERATSLDDLRPPKPPPGNAGAAGERPMIAQIADQLAHLVQLEVEACFDKQFGPLAKQLQSVIDAAKDNGLIPKTQNSAPSDESRADAENSGNSAAKPDRDNN